MKLDLSQDHRITLKRHGKKLWSYQDNKPDVVEAAVLDYLRHHGFDGYFTQRDHYLSLFMRLAGWPGKIFRRFPPGFVNPHYVYYGGPDCGLPLHQFSFSQVMAEVEKTTLSGLSEKLSAFCTGKVFVRYSFSALNRQPDHMLAFLRAFGIERLKKEMKDTFTEHTLQAKRQLSAANTKAISLWGRREEALTTEGLEMCPSFLPVGWPESFAHHFFDPNIKAEVIEASEFSKKWREKTLASHEVTILDLQLWDESGTAIVEVKAPNDRLSPSQKNTIERARARGERACVIYVSEAN